MKYIIYCTLITKEATRKVLSCKVDEISRKTSLFANQFIADSCRRQFVFLFVEIAFLDSISLVVFEMDSLLYILNDWWVEAGDHRTRHLPLFGSRGPWPLALILASYLLFVLKIGKVHALLYFFKIFRNIF